MLEGGKQACHWHPCTPPAEIVRRLEHPPQQETDDWNAAGMEPHSPAAARQESRKVSAASRNASGIPRGQACPPEQPDTNRIRMNDKQACLAHLVISRHCGQGVRRRELSCSYLAGRRSRPDRREGCQAPCPPIFAAPYSPPDRGATAPQGRKSEERG